LKIARSRCGATPRTGLTGSNWTHSFGGKATIRIARLGGDAMVASVHRPTHFGKARTWSARVALSSWALVEDAVVAANFWMLDEHGGDRGFDGARWVIAGNRRHDHYWVGRWCPDDALFDLGRLLFDLAGLDEVRL
jgi:hypothetical protein